jgi:ATP-binding cassette, subfamily F, member 3
MSVLTLKDIDKAFGAEKILSGLSLILDPGDRAGLIGRNGTGKTTLFGIISGRSKPDGGQIAAMRGLSIGYLEQESSHKAGVTLLDEMLSSRPEVLKLKHKLDETSHEVERLAESSGDAYDKALASYGAMLDEFERTGGYAYDNMVEGTLRGLGFSNEDFSRELSTLSGGQRTRLSLAKLLLAGHDLLLLDEPTNHLDIPAIIWLEEFLKSYPGTVLIISHDRYFLDRVANRIYELSGGKTEEFPGNFSAYQIEKEKRVADRLRQYELASGRLEKEKEYINRMRAGQNARQAKGREKRLVRFDMPEKPVVDDRAMSLKWGEVARSSDSVLKAEGISKSFGGNTILKDITFNIRRGDRVGIVGRNGGGKSTLLKIIMGELAPDKGTALFGPKVKVGYYAQGLEGLSEDNTVIEELWGVKPLAVEQEIRDLLGAFLFSGDDSAKRVGSLSGGERGRLAISKIVMSGANFLILDEPTNHLDIPAREALEDAISGFPGTVLAVSHDRYFLDNFAERTFEINEGRLTEYSGNFSYYSEKKAALAEDEVPKEASEGRLSWEERKRQQADEKKREREEARRARSIADLEDSIASLEVRITEVENRLADPEIYGDLKKVSELTECYNILKLERDGLYRKLEQEVV